jgi:predicted Ser/Thr protein kinase
MRCAICSAEVPVAHRFCGACGAPAVPRSQLPTAIPPTNSAPAAPADTPAVRGLSGDGIAAGAFTPGSVLAGRYRVIGLLGRGGMGVVYRADDLKLGTPVALKFLPRSLADDPSRRERFLAEVRIARTVSHPNVCRVYDIAELDGVLFLSMEYIDGEDLASLLKRIGRLPADKALDIARQICAGLAAAHDRGVLHRDLKPANVMLDGRGRVRITDFGLAIATDAATLRMDVSGTPAYMAPEQFTGAGASIRSDIYALGLVLYELHTGKRAFSGTSLGEILDRQQHDPPVAPSRLVTEIDPAVERVILRALASDPRGRPASVAEVAAALPGGSLLDAALRAGETPSPEMVAASGTNEGLEPATAWALVGVLIAGAVLATMVGAQALLWRSSALDRSPEALAEQARAVLARVGYPGAPVDTAYGFETDVDYLRYVRTRDRSRTRWNQSNPSFFRFWHRTSPQPLESWRFVVRYGNLSRVDRQDPPLDIGGMTLVQLDPSGRLIELVVVPSVLVEAAPPTSPLDWAAILEVGGYDPAAWTPVGPQHTPPFYADARAAWEGTWPNRSDVPVRLEAAALRGRLVSFAAIFPWSQPARTAASLLTPAERSGVALVVFTGAAILIGAAVFASRNVRAGRGDRRGAFRLAAFMFTTMAVAWFFGESHVPTLGEVMLVVMGVAWALLVAGCCWVGYLAAEPFVRRRWPRVLVSWTRVLAGDLRDPLVGQHVLIGCVGGTIIAVLGLGSTLVPGWIGLPDDVVPADIIGIAYGLQRAAPLLVWRLAQSVMTGLAAVFVLLLLRLFFRHQGLAIIAFMFLSSVGVAVASDSWWIALTISAVLNGLFALLLLRVGLLAAVVAFYTSGLFIVFPVTVDLSSWYAGAGVAALLVLAALAGFGFTTAVAGRPVFGKA